MKNERFRKSAKSNRSKLNFQVQEYSKCDCVQCDNHHHKLMGNVGRTRILLPNGEWSEEKPCDMYEIICRLDMKTKGHIFTPYEKLEPNSCPMYTDAKKNKTSLLRKIFQSFF